MVKEISMTEHLDVRVCRNRNLTESVTILDKLRIIRKGIRKKISCPAIALLIIVAAFDFLPLLDANK